ncbi:hypothetical protein [Spiroplasma endosymbiont of Stenodema calcarata]
MQVDLISKTERFIPEMGTEEGKHICLVEKLYKQLQFVVLCS